MGKWEDIKTNILADPERLEQYRKHREAVRKWAAEHPDVVAVNLCYADKKVNVIGPEGEL